MIERRVALELNSLLSTKIVLYLYTRGKKQMGINITDLSPLGASLLADNESFLDNVRDLSTEELKISGGGGYGGGYSNSGSGKGGSSRSYGQGKGKGKGGSSSGKYGCGCGYGC